MTCNYDRERLALYVNGDATPEERSATQAHLDGCATCQAIVMQYQAGAADVAATLLDASPVRLYSRRPAHRLWRGVAVAAAMVLALFAGIQVPAVAEQLGKVFPWITVLEMDRSEVARFLRDHNQETPTKVFYPEVFKSVAEAEPAWGGKIPQPGYLPGGMELFRVEVMRWKTQTDVSLYYSAPRAGGYLKVHLSTAPQQRSVPFGATSTVRVNGQKTKLIKGTFGQYSGSPLKWEPDSGMELFFPLGDLYGSVSVGGNPGLKVDELVKVAESIR